MEFTETLICFCATAVKMYPEYHNTSDAIWLVHSDDNQN